MSAEAVTPRPDARAAADSRAILLVGNFLSPEIGGWSVCESLAAELRRSGWTVLTTSSRRNRLARLVDMLATTVARRRDYSVAQVDVYSGNAFVWAECATLALSRLGRPYVLTLHGGNLPSFARRWPGRVRRLLRGAAAVTAPSDYLCDALRPWRADLRRVPNGMDLSAYAYRHRPRPAPSLLWVRAFHRIYNPAMAVRVLERVRRRFPEATLTMVGRDCGDGSFAEAQREAAARGLLASVRFTGAVPKAEIPARMDAADVFLNTADVDNTPVTLFEAMASGLCVVSTDAGGVPYVLETEQTGLMVPRNDDAAMASAVERLLEEAPLSGRISSRGRERAAQADWSRVLPQWEELIAPLARRRT